MSAGFSMRLIEITRILNASQHGVLAGEPILTGVSTDSRSVKAGELFVALSGDNLRSCICIACGRARCRSGAGVARCS